VRDRLSDEDRVAGVAPAVIETLLVTAKGSDLSEPTTDVLGLDENRMNGFDNLKTASGKTLNPSDLGKSEVYLSADAAKGLAVSKGDEIRATFAQKSSPTAAPNAPPAAAKVPGALPIPQPSKLTVAGIYESGANPASSTSMVMPLQRLQERVGEEGRINTVLITHKGPAIEGAAGTDATIDALKPLLKESDLKAEPVKKDAIDQADSGGETFTSIFLLFGQFSVAAGVLLIFLIFVMLAAEREHELGIARAVGMRRGHLMRMFVFEGALYALLASALGSVAGVGVGWLMVRVIGKAFAGSGFEISFATSPQNVVIAFCLGMVLTFAVVRPDLLLAREPPERGEGHTRHPRARQERPQRQGRSPGDRDPARRGGTGLAGSPGGANRTPHAGSLAHHRRGRARSTRAAGTGADLFHGRRNPSARAVASAVLVRPERHDGRH
jgi:putative ABC transport system permease protein